MRTTQRKGDIAVAQAISTFTKLGWDVLLPLTESASYDLVVDVGNELKRVQVKYTSGNEVDLRRIHSNSKGYVIKKTEEDSYDWLYVLSKNRDEYLFKTCLCRRRSVSLQEKDLLIIEY